MRHWLITILLMLTGTITAETPPTHFVVFLASGEDIRCALANRPKVVFGEDVVTVVDGDLTLEYPVEMVHKYRICEPGRDIDAVASVAACEGEFRWQNGDILLSGFGEGERVGVYDLRGSAMLLGTTHAGKTTVVSTAAYPEGVYIIKVGNQSFKFMKR